ncbi:MAG: hypothetical protein LBF70_00150 [Holosporales bacterium]|jgi:NADH:ubiquinone oxidoreductase subunit K|nr:hypothetical protein [Holosporales bacterium]
MIVLISGILFFIGLCGVLLRLDNIIKTLISIEIMIFASIINFGYSSPGVSVTNGHLAILLSAALGCLTFCAIFTILTKKT